MDILKAPWTPEQIQWLTRYQASPNFHPYTCACHNNLIATVRGWICQYCDYTQDWAYPASIDVIKVFWDALDNGVYQ